MRRLVTVALVVGLGLLAGCQDGDDPDPKVPPTESSSPTPTPSPTGPVEPTLPAEAEGDDAAAAEAFVRFYWEMVNYAQASGDIDGLRAITGRGCENCAAATNAIDEIYSQGGKLVGGANRVARLSTAPLFVGDAVLYRVDFELRNGRQRVDMPGVENDRVNEAAKLRARMVVNPDPTWVTDVFEVR